MKKIYSLLILPGFLPLAALAAAPHPLTDAQIAKILVTINEGEVDAAKLAQKKAVGADVKTFAAMMEAHHEKNEEDTKKLAKDQKIGSDKSELSKSLEAEAKQINKGLKEQNEEVFDQAYVAGQIAMHQKALDTIEKTLIPAAHNPALKDHLTATGKSVATHLDQAKSLRKE